MIDSLAHWAVHAPGKIALRLVDGEQTGHISFAELDARAGLFARWLVERGLDEGDSFAILMENRADLLVIAWGARRAGLYYTPVSTHLQPEEIAHILHDCGARMVIVSPQTAALVPNPQEWSGARYELTDSGHEPSAGFTAIAPLLEPPIARSFPLVERWIARPSVVFCFSTSGSSSSSINFT